MFWGGIVTACLVYGMELTYNFIVTFKPMGRVVVAGIEEPQGLEVEKSEFAFEQLLFSNAEINFIFVKIFLWLLKISPNIINKTSPNNSTLIKVGHATQGNGTT